jgi:anti-repressor protein
MTTPGGIQNVIIYSFKGLLGICRFSNQPNANAVIDLAWDMLDEIRRTAVGLPATTNALMSEIERQNAVIKQQEPLVLYAHMTQLCPDAMAVADFARQMRQAGINTGRNRLYVWLCQKGYAYEATKSKYLPLQRGVNEGILQYGSRITVRPDGSLRKSLTLFVTGKGQVRLANGLKREADDRFSMTFRQTTLWA